MSFSIFIGVNYLPSFTVGPFVNKTKGVYVALIIGPRVLRSSLHNIPNFFFGILGIEGDCYIELNLDFLRVRVHWLGQT